MGKASVWALGKNGSIKTKKIDGKPFFLRTDVEAYRPAILNIKGMEYWPAETAAKVAKVKPANLYNKTSTGEWKGVKHNGRCYYSKRDVEQYCRDKGYDDAPTKTTAPIEPVKNSSQSKFVNTLNPNRPEGDDVLINAKQSGAYMGLSKNPFIQLAQKLGLTIYRHNDEDMYRFLDVESLHYDRYKGKHTITQNGIVFISEPLAAHLLRVRPSAVSCTAEKGKFELKVINLARMYNHIEVLKYKNERRPSAVKNTVVLLSMVDASKAEPELAPDLELRRSVHVTAVETPVVAETPETPVIEVAPTVVEHVAPTAIERIAPIIQQANKLDLVGQALALAHTNPEIAKLALEALKG